jgi:hypothetical protein
MKHDSSKFIVLTRVRAILGLSFRQPEQNTCFLDRSENHRS